MLHSSANTSRPPAPSQKCLRRTGCTVITCTSLHSTLWSTDGFAPSLCLAAHGSMRASPAVRWSRPDWVARVFTPSRCCCVGRCRRGTKVPLAFVHAGDRGSIEDASLGHRRTRPSAQGRGPRLRCTRGRPVGELGLSPSRYWQQAPGGPSSRRVAGSQFDDAAGLEPGRRRAACPA